MKCVGRILYSADQSTLTGISLELWHIRERGYSNRGGVSDQTDTNRAVMPSSAASSVAQLTWYGPLSITGSWE